MNFAKLISTFKGMTSDSKRTDHHGVIMEMIDIDGADATKEMADKIININEEVIYQLLEMYTSDSYRVSGQGG